MKREIKFRAWDGKNMHYWDSVCHKATDQITGTPYPKLFYLPMSWLIGDSNDWEWMQFTGLLDKNGKEIYEGDIVKGCRPWEETENYTHHIEVVEFKEYSDCCVTGVGYGFGEQGDPVDSNEVEIIGNIYENTELLK